MKERFIDIAWIDAVEVDAVCAKLTPDALDARWVIGDIEPLPCDLHRALASDEIVKLSSTFERLQDVQCVYGLMLFHRQLLFCCLL